MKALVPPVSLLAKLGSVVGHVEEMLGPDGHRFDRVAIDSLLADPELREWMAEMRKAQFVPEPRS